MSPRRDQPVQLGFELGGLGCEVGWGERGLPVAQSQGGAQDGCHVTGKADRAAGLARVQFTQVIAQMPDALLLEPGGQGQMVVGGNAIRDQDARERFPKNLDDHLVTASCFDGVDRQVAVGEDPQPGGQGADPPAGFIAVSHRALAASRQVNKFGIHRPGLLGQAGIRLAQPTPDTGRPKPTAKTSATLP